MLETLTPAQEKRMHEVREEYLAKFFTLPRIREAKCRQWVDWMYSLINLPPPELVIVDSPMEAQRIANKLMNEANGTNETRYFSSYYGKISDYGWTAFYDLFSEFGVFKNEQFDQWKVFVDTGVFSTIPLDTHCIVCSNPKALTRDEEKRLHALDGPAIAWADGFDGRFIHGVSFDKDLFEKAVSKALSFKEIMAFENIEQRMIALKLMDVDALLKGANAKFLDKGKKGAELFLIEDIFDDKKAYFTRYNCPSTGELFLSGIDPEVGAKGSADECMAFKQNIPVERYLNNKNES